MSLTPSKLFLIMEYFSILKSKKKMCSTIPITKIKQISNCYICFKCFFFIFYFCEKKNHRWLKTNTNFFPPPATEVSFYLPKYILIILLFMVYSWVLLFCYVLSACHLFLRSVQQKTTAITFSFTRNIEFQCTPELVYLFSS